MYGKPDNSGQMYRWYPEKHLWAIIVDREMVIITLQHQKTLYLFFKVSKEGN